LLQNEFICQLLLRHVLASAVSRLQWDLQFFNLCSLIWRISCTRLKTCDFPEDDQQLRPKHIKAIINKQKCLAQVGFKYYFY